MEIKTVLFFGRSGSGKGTQADLLKEYLEKNDPERKVFHIETGKLFRELATGPYYTSKLVASVIKEGGLFPEFLPIWLWTEILVKNTSLEEHVILDGVARREPEARILDNAVSFLHRPALDVVNINVSREWATGKLLARGRKDDNEKEISNRLDWYDTNVVPSINYFKNESKTAVFHEINGEQTIENVHRDVIKAIFRKE